MNFARMMDHLPITRAITLNTIEHYGVPDYKYQNYPYYYEDGQVLNYDLVTKHYPECDLTIDVNTKESCSAAPVKI